MATVPRVLIVADEVQHRDEQQPGGLAWADQPPDGLMVQDLLWLAQVGVDHGGVVVAVQDDFAVRDGDRVDVRVDDARGGVGLLGDLVHVALGRDAGTYVEELPDTVPGQEPDGPAQERPVGPGERPGVGVYRGESPARVLVDQDLMATSQ